MVVSLASKTSENKKLGLLPRKELFYYSLVRSTIPIYIQVHNFENFINLSSILLYKLSNSNLLMIGHPNEWSSFWPSPHSQRLLSVMPLVCPIWVHSLYKVLQIVSTRKFFISSFLAGSLCSISGAFFLAWGTRPKNKTKPWSSLYGYMAQKPGRCRMHSTWDRSRNFINGSWGGFWASSRRLSCKRSRPWTHTVQFHQIHVDAQCGWTTQEAAVV